MSDATKCPLCEYWIIDTLSPSRNYFINGLFCYRYDLISWVCKDCDYKLGADSVRVKGLSMSSNPNALSDFLKQYA